MAGHCSPQELDWLSSRRSYLLAWGLPTAALIGAIWITAPGRTLVWALALVWMGAACLRNARRCGRMHCYFTGPFFLIMASVVLLHGFGILPLGADGWTWVGITMGVGGGGLWWLTERVWGKFRRPADPI